MTVLDMNPATLPADARALYERMAARRKSKMDGKAMRPRASDASMTHAKNDSLMSRSEK